MSRASMLLLLVSAAGAASLSAQQMPTFRADTHTVPVYATVLDSSGRLVPNLSREDFDVLDDGAPQPLTLFANDVQPEMIEILRRRLAAQRVTNVTLVQGTVDDPRLPAASVDLALMVDVYHELSRPQAMLQKLRAALKPAGRLVLLEYRKEDPSIPIKFEHKMSIQEAKAELEAEGFSLAKVDESLPRQHILIFTVAVH